MDRLHVPIRTHHSERWRLTPFAAGIAAWVFIIGLTVLVVTL